MAKHPRNMSQVTRPRNFSQTMQGHLNFSLKEIPKDTQVYELEKAQKKTARHIRNLTKAKIANPSQAADYEKKILYQTNIAGWRQMRINLLKRKIEEHKAQQLAITARLKAEMQMHIKNLAKIPEPDQKPDGIDGFHTEIISGGNIGESKKADLPRQRLDRTGGRRKVVVVKKKQWSLK